MPHVYYDGPREREMFWRREAGKMLKDIRGPLTQGKLTHEHLKKRFEDGTVIEVTAVHNVGEIEVVKISVPGGKKPPPVEEKKKKRRGSEILTRTVEQPIPVPEVYFDTSSHPTGWLPCSLGFAQIAYGKASEEATVYDVKLESNERVAVLYPLAGNVDHLYNVDEKRLERWDTFDQWDYTQDNWTEDHYTSPWSPPPWQPYYDCIILDERLNPPGGAAPSCLTDPSEIHEITWCGCSLLIPDTDILAYGPDSPGVYDTAGVAPEASRSAYTRTSHDYDTYEYTMILLNRDYEPAGRAVYEETVSLATDTIYEWWTNIIGDYSETHVTDMTQTYNEVPEPRATAFNENTLDYAIVFDERSDVCWRDLSYDTSFIPPYPAGGMTYEDQTLRVFLRFNDEEYDIWTSPSFNAGSFAYYADSRDCKIYKYGDEFIVVFAVICGQKWTVGVGWSYESCVTIYGMLFKGELHLSEQYPSSMNSQIDSNFPTHRWPELVVDNKQAYGKGLIHSALLLEIITEEKTWQE